MKGRKPHTKVAMGVLKGLGGLVVVGVGLLYLLAESQKDDNSNVEHDEKENKSELYLKDRCHDDSKHFNSSNTLDGENNDNNNHEKNKKYVNEPINIQIDKEAQNYLKSLLSQENVASIQNNYNYHHDQKFHMSDVSKLLPFTMCSISVEADLVYMIFSFLPIENILTIQTIDEKFYCLTQCILNDRTYLRCCARRGFYNRSIVWPWIVGESMEEYQNLYIDKIAQWQQIETGELEIKEFKNTYRALQKDIHRTFSNGRALNLSEQQQQQLQKLLGIYSLLDPEVGYVQGMNFIAGTVIFAVDDELDAFSIFYQLMKRDDSKPNCEKPSVANINNINVNNNQFCNSYCAGGRLSKKQQYGYGLRDMFTHCLPGCLVALLEFEQLIQKHLPILYEHMKNEDVTISSFASEWFLTLYGYVLPLSLTLRVYDIFLVDGWKILHRVGLAILSRAQNTLLTLAIDDMTLYLKQFPDSGIFISPEDEEDGDAFIEHAFSFKITNYDLHKYANDLLQQATTDNMKT